MQRDNLLIAVPEAGDCHEVEVNLFQKRELRERKKQGKEKEVGGGERGQSRRRKKEEEPLK